MAQEQFVPGLAETLPDSNRVFARQDSLIAIPVHSENTTTVIIEVQVFRIRHQAYSCSFSVPLGLSALQVGIDANLDIVAQRIRNRAALLGLLGHLFKACFVQSWHLASCIEIHG